MLWIVGHGPLDSPGRSWNRPGRLALAGCGTRSEPTGELAPSYPVTVDGAGDAPTTLESEPKRIVALDAGSAELITAIGAGDRLVGAPAGVRVEGGKQPAVVIEDTGTWTSTGSSSSSPT